MRVKAVIAYDGSGFNGFQRQRNRKIVKTVTETIEDCLFSLEIKSKIVGSGRTDAKVHATHQVIHFDLPYFWENQSLSKLKFNINKKLKSKSIYFKTVDEVDSGFHSRFDAKRRLYRYIFKRKSVNIFEKDYVSELRIENIELFKIALNHFIGEHNFIFLSKRGSETKTTIRNIYKINLRKRKDYYFLYIQGDGFLRAQIRSMIFLAQKFANSEISINSLKEQLKGEKRHFSGLVSPYGLYLAGVYY